MTDRRDRTIRVRNQHEVHYESGVGANVIYPWPRGLLEAMHQLPMPEVRRLCESA